jgi:hypothetical protein
MSPARTACVGACIALVGAAACDQRMRIGRTDTLNTAIVGTDGATADAPATGATFVSFEMVSTWTQCPDGGSFCTSAWTLDASGVLTCPDSTEVQVSQDDLQAFEQVATAPQTLSALSDPACADAEPVNSSDTVTLRLGDRVPLVKDIGPCPYETYYSLRFAVFDLDAQYCGGRTDT